MAPSARAAREPPTTHTSSDPGFYGEATRIFPPRIRFLPFARSRTAALDRARSASHMEGMRTLASIGFVALLAACSGGLVTIPDTTDPPGGGGTLPGADASAGGDASNPESDAEARDGESPPDPTDGSPTVDATPPPANCNVDFVLVANSSGSMSDKQTAYLAATKTLPSQILALNDGKVDAHFAVTTADVDSPATAGLFMRPATAGCEQPAINRLWLTSSDTNLDAAFACRANVGVNGSGVERGLRALSLAVEAAQNRAFFRTGALLAYLMILDDGDESTDAPATVVSATVGKLDALTPRRTGVIFAPKMSAAGCAVSAQNTIVEDFVARETAARATRADMCNTPHRFDLAVATLANRIDARCRSRD